MKIDTQLKDKAIKTRSITCKAVVALFYNRHVKLNKAFRQRKKVDHLPICR